MRLRDAARPRVVGEPRRGRVVVAAEAAILWILVKLLGANDSQLQRDAKVVLLAVELAGVGLANLVGQGVWFGSAEEAQIGTVLKTFPNVVLGASVTTQNPESSSLMRWRASRDSSSVEKKNCESAIFPTFIASRKSKHICCARAGTPRVSRAPPFPCLKVRPSPPCAHASAHTAHNGRVSARVASGAGFGLRGGLHDAPSATQASPAGPR